MGVGVRVVIRVRVTVRVNTTQNPNPQPNPPKVERGSSAVECRTRNQMSPGSNPPLLPFRRFGIFVLSIDAPVDSAV